MDGGWCGGGRDGGEVVESTYDSPPVERKIAQNIDEVSTMVDDELTLNDKARLDEYLAGAAAADKALEYQGSNQQRETIYKTTAFFVERLNDLLDGKHRRPEGVCDCRLCTVLRDHGVNVDGPPPAPLPHAS